MPKNARPPLEDKQSGNRLESNAIPLRTLSIDGGLRGLAPLARKLTGVRIVRLGESTHGDGLAFAPNVRLVRRPMHMAR